jgi:hypothetical protein
LVSSLYSTHRGAWYNPAKEVKGKWVSDNVPSFVEIKLKDITFPDKESEKESDSQKVYQYYFEARSNGTTVASELVTRPKKSWMALIKCYDNKLVFGDKRIYVPVPPGAYCKPGFKIDLALFRCPLNDLAAMSFRDLLAANRRGARTANSPSRSTMRLFLWMVCRSIR